MEIPSKGEVTMEYRINVHRAVDQDGTIHLYRHYTTKTLCNLDKSYRSNMAILDDYGLVTCEECRDALRIHVIDIADEITGVLQLVKAQVNNARLRNIA